ncbi:MAG: calcium/sodium antiporter [Saprospirales bacterium]|nr:calcium/sodium antiporter [Saprospirales bacterium]
MVGELLLYALIFIVSLAALLKASDWFVDTAERVGLSLGIPPFIIGVTIIAFGTSLPELASSIAAVLAGESEIVVGNVVGSNITNILLIIGLVALVSKEVQLEFRVMDTEIPLLIGSALLLWFTLYDLGLSPIEVGLLLSAMVVFIVSSVQGGKEYPKLERSKVSWKSYSILLVSVVLIYLGANYTIFAIQKVSIMAGIGSEFLALTVVSLGTSLPEVVVSVTAARKNKVGMAIGNVIGSNIFNTYSVMGIPALFGKLVIPAGIVDFSLPFMLGITFFFSILCITHRISKTEGVLLLTFYAFFLIELTSSI